MVFALGQVFLDMGFPIFLNFWIFLVNGFRVLLVSSSNLASHLASHSMKSTVDHFISSKMLNYVNSSLFIESLIVKMKTCTMILCWIYLVHPSRSSLLLSTWLFLVRMAGIDMKEPPRPLVSQMWLEKRKRVSAFLPKVRFRKAVSLHWRSLAS